MSDCSNWRGDRIKATVEREFMERRSGDSGAWSVTREQFIARLPTKTVQWVQCHRPTSLDLAIQLAEDQMTACHGVGESLPSVSLSLPPSSSISPPFFLPRSRAGVLPRAQPRWRGGPAPESAAVRAHAREAGSASPSSALFPVPPGSPRQFLGPLGSQGSLGRPVGVAGTRATSSIGVQ